jgi:hypothetical protein
MESNMDMVDFSTKMEGYTREIGKWVIWMGLENSSINLIDLLMKDSGKTTNLVAKELYTMNVHSL